MHLFHCYHTDNDMTNCYTTFKIPLKTKCMLVKHYIENHCDHFSIDVMKQHKCCICHKIKFMQMHITKSIVDIDNIDKNIFDWYDYKKNNYVFPNYAYDVIANSRIKAIIQPVYTTPTTISQLVDNAEHASRHDITPYDKLDKLLDE